MDELRDIIQNALSDMEYALRGMQAGVTDGYAEVAQSIQLVGRAIDANTVGMRTFALLPQRGPLSGLTEVATDLAHAAIDRTGMPASAPHTPPGSAHALDSMPAVDPDIFTGPPLDPRDAASVVRSVRRSTERIRNITDPEEVDDCGIRIQNQ
jgi:hypothetical protein